MNKNYNRFDVQADFCKILTSPKRLEILSVLKGGEKTVTELVNILGISKANLSQHLSILKNRGIIKSRREGINTYYSISNPKVIKACDLIMEIMKELHEEKRSILSSNE